MPRFFVLMPGELREDIEPSYVPKHLRCLINTLWLWWHDTKPLISSFNSEKEKSMHSRPPLGFGRLPMSLLRHFSNLFLLLCRESPGFGFCNSAATLVSAKKTCSHGNGVFWVEFPAPQKINPLCNVTEVSLIKNRRYSERKQFNELLAVILPLSPEENISIPAWFFKAVISVESFQTKKLRKICMLEHFCETWSIR